MSFVLSAGGVKKACQKSSYDSYQFRSTGFSRGGLQYSRSSNFGLLLKLLFRKSVKQLDLKDIVHTFVIFETEAAVESLAEPETRSPPINVKRPNEANQSTRVRGIRLRRYWTRRVLGLVPLTILKNWSIPDFSFGKDSRSEDFQVARSECTG